ncbi:MAG: replication and repair protein RecF [Marmoricola sp.]|nr:replication and repair protein RecF [Marmoricola sp.]
MYVAHLTLHDFRSYASLEVELEPGVTSFVGRNGQGKTNVVEAIDYLSRLASHRVSGDLPLVRKGAERAVVRAAVVRDERRAVLEVEINPGRSNRARVNRGQLPRARDLLGLVRTVVFAPDDLALVKGDPTERRRFLDDLLVLHAGARYAGTRADYDRVLKQRNSLLKTGRSRGTSAGVLETLGVWDERLARLGSEIMVARAGIATELDPLLGKAYEAVARGATRDDAHVVYRPSFDPFDPGLDTGPGVPARPPDGFPLVEQRAPASVSKPGAPADVDPAGVGLDDGPGGPARPTGVDLGDPATAGRWDLEAVERAFLAEIERRRSDELDRGVSLVGPHRDELVCTLGEFPVKGYASHGEGWSFALAMRLSSYELLRAGGDDPILVLDDVFAELDTGRRAQLAGLVAGAEQVLVTAAVAEDVPEGLRGRRFEVSGGEVTLVG